MSRINELLDSLVERRLTELLGDVDTTVNRSEGRTARTVAAEAHTDAPTVNHTAVRHVAAKLARTRRSGPSTAYVVNAVADVDSMTPEVAAHYDAIVKASRKRGGRFDALTEADIIRARGRKDASAQNAAQSAIWWLRNHGADGKRVKAGSKAAILHNVSVE
jgi:hypothetical protein